MSSSHRDRSVLSGHSLAGSASPAPRRARCVPSAAAPASPSLGKRGERGGGRARDVSNPLVGPPPATNPAPALLFQSRPKPRPQHASLTAAIAGSDLPVQSAQRRRLLRGWNDPHPPRKHSRSPAGTCRTPFPASGPAPGTEGSPPTHYPVSRVLNPPAPHTPGGLRVAVLHAPFVLSRSWWPSSVPRSVEAVEKRLLQVRPGDSGTVLSPMECRDPRLGTQGRGGQAYSALDVHTPRGDKRMGTCTHIHARTDIHMRVHTAQRRAQTLFTRIHTQTQAGVWDPAVAS